MAKISTLRFYKFSFGAYKLLLIAIVIFAWFGDPALGIVGVDEGGLDFFSATFFIASVLLIVLGLILQFVHLPVRLRHTFSYIATLLIFITVLYDAYGLYASFSVEDYSLISAFLLLFSILAGISFYAVFTKKIQPLRFAP
ncbi:MAG TPA: hypothetical protein VHB48_03430 [Chitinophagaceae bacterium]|nr:hypothetical protein [Chitinophagaceae bacterium]